jgi:hypothetical protein
MDRVSRRLEAGHLSRGWGTTFFDEGSAPLPVDKWYAMHMHGKQTLYFPEQYLVFKVSGSTPTYFNVGSVVAPVPSCKNIALIRHRQNLTGAGRTVCCSWPYSQHFN